MTLDIWIPAILTCFFFGLIIATGIGFSYLWLIWLGRQASKCPECGRSGAGERTTAEILEQHTYTEREGGIWNTREWRSQNRRPVQIIETTYEDHYTCRHCGHKWVKVATEKTRSDDPPAAEG